MTDIQKYLEDLIDAGLRQRLIDLIKVYLTVLFCSINEGLLHGFAATIAIFITKNVVMYVVFL